MQGGNGGVPQSTSSGGGQQEQWPSSMYPPALAQQQQPLFAVMPSSAPATATPSSSALQQQQPAPPAMVGVNHLTPTSENMAMALAQAYWQRYPQGNGSSAPAASNSGPPSGSGGYVKTDAPALSGGAPPGNNGGSGDPAQALQTLLQATLLQALQAGNINPANLSNMPDMSKLPQPVSGLTAAQKPVGMEMESISGRSV